MFSLQLHFKLSDLFPLQKVHKDLLDLPLELEGKTWNVIFLTHAALLYPCSL